MSKVLEGYVVLFPGSVADAMEQSSDMKQHSRSSDDPDLDTLRVVIQNLGGKIAHAEKSPAGSMWGDSNEDPTTATHEYVPKGSSPLTHLPVLGLTELRAHTAQALHQLTDFCQAEQRAAYLPQVVGSEEATQTGSHYFGKPWMPRTMEWPTYGDEGIPMTFVLQLAIASLPEEIQSRCGGDGLLLFFHVGSEGDYPMEDNDNRAMSHVCMVSLAEEGGCRETPESVKENAPLTIMGWDQVADYPSYEDISQKDGYASYELLSPETLFEFVGRGENLRDVSGEEIRTTPDHPLAPFHCIRIDKLGGWPAWEQGNETPLAPSGTPMEYVMQVGYEGITLPAAEKEKNSWPTWGRGHIFRSPEDGSFVYIWAND